MTLDLAPEDFELIVQGLEALRAKLLNDAGEPAYKRISRRPGAFEATVIEPGRRLLKQVDVVQRLAERLKAAKSTRASKGKSVRR